MVISGSASQTAGPLFWFSGGRICPSFIPGMCNHSGAHSVSNAQCDCLLLHDQLSAYGLLHFIFCMLCCLSDLDYSFPLLSQNGPSGTNLSLLSRNPLASSHEFRQACHACYSRIGWSRSLCFAWLWPAIFPLFIVLLLLNAALHKTWKLWR